MDEPLDTLGTLPPPGAGSSSGVHPAMALASGGASSLPVRENVVPEGALQHQALAAERMTRRRTLLTLAAALTGAAGLLLWRDLSTALLFLACAAVTRIFLPSVGRFAHRQGAVALPGGRGIHELPTPLIGGAALFIPVALTLLVLGLLGDAKAWGLLAGGTIVFLVGLYDDIKGTRARHKIFAQLLAGGVLLAAGFQLPAFGIPGVGVLELAPAFVGPCVLLCWIVLASNALNLSDGLDGLATSLTILGMGVLAAAGGQGLVPVALAGACLGFLYFNLPKARIFLGDAGSLLLGFLLAALVLQFPVQANVPLALAAFAYPLGDVSLAVTRRLVRGKPLFAPDRSHIHHKALQYLGSPTRALLALLAFSALQAAALVTWPGVPALIFCAALWVTVGAALAFVGGYQPAQLMLTRRGMQRLHVVQRRARASIGLAQDIGDLEQALGYLAGAVGVEHLSVGSLHVDACEGSSAQLETPEVRVTLLATDPRVTARFCTWSAAPTMEGPAVDQERETIMASLLRQAADRLQSLEPASLDLPHPILRLPATPRPAPSPPAASPPAHSPPDLPACSPTLTRTRPARRQA